MLKVSFDERNKKLKLRLKGHSGQADIGHDIVCASCSILAYTVAQMVKFEEMNGGLVSSPKIKLESGNAVICCEPKEERYAEMLHAYHVAEVGYSLLAHNYPQFVDLKMFGETEKS